MAKPLNVPGYYRINKLRLRMDKSVKLLHGFLGGNERKIQNLTLDAGDERYAELIRWVELCYVHRLLIHIIV